MSKMIFLVDDSPTVLASISAALTKAGYTTQTASSADAALAKFRSGVKPDLIITDLNMPGKDGITFIKEVRTTVATHKFVPILFLTTESQQSKRMEAKAAGASGWLVKPAKPDELLQAIRMVVR